jgi:hypothetical protein
MHFKPRMFAELTQRGKSTAFQAGFQRRFMPQNKFCGYENLAFQAQKVFNSPANFCLKGNKYATYGQRRPCNPCLKGRTTAVAQTNIRAGKKRTNKTKIRNLKFPLPTSPLLS